MVSISSAKNIRKRTNQFCKKNENWDFETKNSEIIPNLYAFIKKEYDMIPEKERIGKGTVYIVKYIAKEFFLFMEKKMNYSLDYLINFLNEAFEWGEGKEDYFLEHFVLLLLAEIIHNNPSKLVTLAPLIKRYANHDDWQIRESSMYSVIKALKKNPSNTLDLLKSWITSDSENIRRLIAESLRPRAEIKWLRNSKKNDPIIEILSKLKRDPSIYVRKAVGNNLKDLSKYMPEKILNLMEHWIQDADIEVHDTLASEKGLGHQNKRLIWTMKFALRWIKDRNPEYHSRLEHILGKNYILYYDEKSNRRAKPKK
jgi:3-methyladenine DNA glycosylase AlkC